MKVSIQDLPLGVHSILVEANVHGWGSLLGDYIDLVRPRVDTLLTVASIEFVHLHAAHQRASRSLS